MNQVFQVAGDHGAVRGISEATNGVDESFSESTWMVMASIIKEQSGCTEDEALTLAKSITDTSKQFYYERWRHGGWYVGGVRYPSGATGCVSSNFADKKWRIVCDDRRINLNEPGDFTFRSRDEAARAEQILAIEAWKQAIAERLLQLEGSDECRLAARDAGYTVHPPTESTQGWAYCIDGDYSEEFVSEKEAWAAAYSALTRSQQVQSERG